MRQTRLQIARSDIVKFFDSSPLKVFSRSQIDEIVQSKRSFWRLAQRTTTQEVLTYLLKTSKLKELDFAFPARKEVRYVWDKVPLLEVTSTLKPNSYISHYSAMKIHGLTDQIPKTIYINSEQRGRSNPNASIKQKSIAFAFSQPQRVSNNIAEFGDYRICLLSGQNTNQAGVVTETVPDIGTDLDATIQVTNLERTLIDIAVRPIYAGGVYQIAEAYRRAAGRVSINRLVALLKQIGYVYPFHQAIGFYLEHAGEYRLSAIDLLREMPQEYDFYLTHQMKKSHYVKDWRLFVPEGM